jgi:hypothetical protein
VHDPPHRTGWGSPSNVFLDVHFVWFGSKSKTPPSLSLRSPQARERRLKPVHRRAILRVRKEIFLMLSKKHKDVHEAHVGLPLAEHARWVLYNC